MNRRTLGWLGDAYVALVAAWALAWKLWRDRAGLLGMVNAWGFWLLATGLPVGALRLGRRSRWLAAGWTAAGLTLLARHYPYARPARPEETRSAAETRLRFMGFNVLMGNRQPATVAAMIEREAPDVVALQELEPAMHRALEGALAAMYPHRHYQPSAKRGGGLGVYSKVPLAVTGFFQSGRFRPFALRMTLGRQEGPVDVYNVHLLPTSGRAVWRMGPTANFGLRADQARQLAAEVAARGVPAVVIGDHNFTEMSEGYQSLAAALVDAWRVAGQGMGWTFPRSGLPLADRPSWPVLRIDYAFCNGLVRPLCMHVVRDLIGSDHCPIVLDAEIAERPVAVSMPWAQEARVEGRAA